MSELRKHFAVEIPTAMLVGILVFIAIAVSIYIFLTWHTGVGGGFSDRNTFRNRSLFSEQEELDILNAFAAQAPGEEMSVGKKVETLQKLSLQNNEGQTPMTEAQKLNILILQALR